jgi:FKBP-type peptidyl-prolyl cis-trans isomerase FklB
MKKSIAIVITILPLALLFIGNSAAQQTPPANTQQGAASSGAQQAPASGTQTAAPKSSITQGTKSAQTPGARKTVPPLTLKTDKDKSSYAIGMNIGKGLKRDAVDVDPAILARGIKDALAGQKTLLTDDEAKTLLTALQNEMRKKQMELRQQAMEAQKQAGEANKKEGDAFLAENKTKDGVVTLPSGLQYKVLKDGDGPKPTAADSVVCNYRGTLINGTEFDSSYKRGQPATFGVGQVIKGWTEALQLMPVGSKWQLFIPAELAYGERAPGGPIGPNSMLIFEVELLSIQPKEQPKDAKQPSAP